MPKILSGAAERRNVHHTDSGVHTHTHMRTRTHVRRSAVDSLLLCQGISRDQSQSFVSPGVKKKLKQRGGGCWRGTCKDWELTRSSWHSKKKKVLQKRWQEKLPPISVPPCVIELVRLGHFCSGCRAPSSQIQMVSCV